MRLNNPADCDSSVTAATTSMAPPTLHDCASLGLPRSISLSEDSADATRSPWGARCDSSLAVNRLSYAFKASLHILAYFVHPESHNAPASGGQYYVTVVIFDSASATSIAMPGLPVHFHVHLDTRSEHRKIQKETA